MDGLGKKYAWPDAISEVLKVPPRYFLDSFLYGAALRIVTQSPMIRARDMGGNISRDCDLFCVFCRTEVNEKNYKTRDLQSREFMVPHFPFHSLQSLIRWSW